MREDRAAQVADAGVMLAREWQGEQVPGTGRKGLRALFELARRRYPDEEEAALFVAAFLAALPAPATDVAPAEQQGAPQGVTLH